MDASIHERYQQPHIPLWEHRLAHLQLLDQEGLETLQEEYQQQLYWHWARFLDGQYIASLLTSYCRMGFYPGVNMMDSLLLAVQPQLPYMSSREISKLLQLLAALRHVPGPQVCVLPVWAVKDGVFLRPEHAHLITMCSVFILLTSTCLNT